MCRANRKGPNQAGTKAGTAVIGDDSHLIHHERPIKFGVFSLTERGANQGKPDS